MEYLQSNKYIIWNISIIYSIHQDKLDNEEYLKNIYEPFIFEQMYNVIKLYKKYKVPFNNYIKSHKNYISKILSTLYNINDYTNFKITNDNFEFPQNIPSKTISSMIIQN